MRKHIGKILLIFASILYLLIGALQLSMDTSTIWKKDVNVATINTPDLPVVEEELIEIAEVNESEQIPIEPEEVDLEDQEVLVTETMPDNLKWIWLTLLKSEMFCMIFAALLGFIFFKTLKKAKFLFWLSVYIFALQTLNYIYWSLIFGEWLSDVLVYGLLFFSTLIYMAGAYLNMKQNTEGN